MTTRLCLGDNICSPFKSSRQIALQTPKDSRRYPDSYLSLRTLGFVTKVAAFDEKQASDSVEASVDGFSLHRPRRASTAQSSSGSLSLSEDCAGAVLGESDETQRPLRLQDLRVGFICKGKVSAIESYGIFIDIGAYTEGFVHVSRLGRSFVRRVEDVVKVGEDVCVQIVDLDFRSNIISLRLRPNDGSDERVALRPLTLPECEVVNRAVERRAKQMARRAENPLPRRVMNLETRRRLKAYRRAVLAERQAIQLHQAKTNAIFPNDFDELDEISLANR